MTEVKQDGLVAWAMSVSGEPYVVSVLNDFSVEPRWRPEWIADHFLVADVYGRVSSTVQVLPEDRVPKSWRASVDAAKAWIEEKHLALQAHFPAVLEDARTTTVSFAELEPLADLYRRFADEPTPDHSLMLVAAVYLVGFPAGVGGDALKVVNGLRGQPGSLDDREVQSMLVLGAHISAQASDLALADAVAETCIEKVRFAEKRQSVTEAVFRLIECAAANPSRTAAQSMLAQRPPRRPERPDAALVCGDPARSSIPGRRIASLTSRWCIDTFPRAEKNHRYPHNQEGRVFQAAMAERGLKVRGPRSA